MGDAAHTWGGDIDLDNVQVVPKKSITQKSGSLKAIEAGEDVVVREADLLRWSVTCLEIAGASTDHAESQVLKSYLCEKCHFQAKLLMAADRRGHFSHGFNRLAVTVS